MNAATDALISASLAGTASEEELAALSRLIESDAAVRDRYLALAEVHALLTTHETLWEKTAPVPLPAAVPVGRRQHGVWKALAAGLAAAAVIAVAAVMYSPGARPRPVPHNTVFAPDGPVSTQENPATAVAILKQTAGVTWSRTPAPAVGAALPAGRLKFSSGSLQLEFLSGAQLVVQGPAEVELESENAAWLHSGTATAYVPEPAQGFLLKTAGAVVEDLGTSFGLTAGAGKSPEVHVFEGVVEVQPDRGERLRLAAHQAIRVDAPQTAAVPLRVTDFPNAAALQAEADRNGAGELTAWRQSVARLSEDPDVAAVFPFWQDGELPAAAAAVGAEWTEGRWPQKHALDFHSPSDRLRFHVPGTLTSLTLLARVRVDALTNDYNALLLPTHYAKGSLHWILERGGELRLTMLASPREPLTMHGWDGPVSAPAVSSMDFGRWICLATTYDSSTGEVIHYCDGREAGRGKLARHLPAQLGDVEFGNWGADGSSPDNAWIPRQAPNHRKRHFTGRLDFLTVIRRVLTPDELRPLMQP